MVPRAQESFVFLRRDGGAATGCGAGATGVPSGAAAFRPFAAERQLLLQGPAASGAAAAGLALATGAGTSLAEGALELERQNGSHCMATPCTREDGAAAPPTTREGTNCVAPRASIAKMEQRGHELRLPRISESRC